LPGRLQKRGLLRSLRFLPGMGGGSRLDILGAVPGTRVAIATAALGTGLIVIAGMLLLPFPGTLPEDLPSKGHRDEAEVPSFSGPRPQSILGLDGELGSDRSLSR